MKHQRKSGRVTVMKHDFGTHIVMTVEAVAGTPPLPRCVFAQVHEPYGLKQQRVAVSAAAKEFRHAA